MSTLSIQYCAMGNTCKIKDLDSLGQVTITSISHPLAFESFDLSIIDLSEDMLWRYKGSNPDSIDNVMDLKSIGQMLSEDYESLVIIILPLNIRYMYSKYHLEYTDNRYIKDIIGLLIRHVNIVVGDIDIKYAAYSNVIPETDTSSSFYLVESDSWEKILAPNNSQNAVMVRKINTHTYLTTVNGMSAEDLKTVIVEADEWESDKEVGPEWMEDVNMFDDNDQAERISLAKEEIKEQNEIISQAKLRLKENARFKSILYTTGDELVGVVTEILEKTLDINTSGFLDERKEDLRFYLDGVTYVVEIKGVSHNIRRENVSQLDLHVQGVIDDSEDTTVTKGILIMNHQRSKPLSERIKVNKDTIALARRNGSLIIESSVLLELYESYLNKELTSDTIKKVLANHIGILTKDDWQ